MKTTHKINIKALVFLISSLACATLQAQDMGEDYLGKTGLFSRLYSGKIETPYNLRLYEGNPYYRDRNYAEGSIVLNNIFYGNQNIRLDLYRQQVVVLSPANQALIMPFARVQKVDIYGRVFLWIVPPKNSGLKNEGFYVSCFEGGKISLLCEERVVIQDKKAVPLVFEREIKYYLGVGGKYYHVKNKSDFLRLFPEEKKQINKYTRENRLDFIDAKEQSMIALATFCDNL